MSDVRIELVCSCGSKDLELIESEDLLTSTGTLDIWRCKRCGREYSLNVEIEDNGYTIAGSVELKVL